MRKQSTHIHLRRKLKLFCSPDDAPLSTKPNVPCSPEDTPLNFSKSQHSIHGNPDTNIGVHPRIKPTSPIHHLATTPSQHLHPRTPNPHRFRCGRWKREQGRSDVTNLAVLLGALDASFPSTYGQNPSIRPRAAPRLIPARPTGRSALMGTRFLMVQGTKGISITETILIPDSELSDCSDSRMATVTAAMSMVQEDRKTQEDELRQSLSLKRLRTSAKCRWIKTPSDVAERCQGGLLQVRNVWLSHDTGLSAG